MMYLKNALPKMLCCSLLLLGSCRPTQKEENPTKEMEERVEPPEQIISLEESKSLYDNYSKNRVEMIQQFETAQHPDEKFRPARFSSWDYATIKQYMDFIEQEAESAGVEVASLRFYFGNYPNKERFPNGKKVVHPRQNAIFIVPTIDVDGQDHGFYIGEDGKAKLIKDAIANNAIGTTPPIKEKNQAGFFPAFVPPANSSQSLTLNFGHSGPPPASDYQ